MTSLIIKRRLPRVSSLFLRVETKRCAKCIMQSYSQHYKNSNLSLLTDTERSIVENNLLQLLNK